MMSDDEILAVVQAHKEGKQIERHYFEWSDDHWVKDDFPSWDFCKCRYRVSHLLKGYCFAKDIHQDPTIGMVKVEQVPLAKGENPLVRKQDAATQQIVRKAALECIGKTGSEKEAIILSAVERAYEAGKDKGREIKTLSTSMMKHHMSQPQPSKGSPASGERSEPTPEQLQELKEAANEARARVSKMSHTEKQSLEDAARRKMYGELPQRGQQQEWTPVGMFGINVGAETFTPQCYDTGSRDVILDAHNSAEKKRSKHDAEVREPLVKALVRIRTENLIWIELQNIAADALAKVPKPELDALEKDGKC